MEIPAARQFASPPFPRSLVLAVKSWVADVRRMFGRGEHKFVVVQMGTYNIESVDRDFYGPSRWALALTDRLLAGGM